VRFAAKSLAYRIPPNVTSNILDDFLRPQNVIVVAHLPEPLVMSFLEFIPGALFEGVNKLNQVGGVRESLTKEMNVVRHDAIGVKREITLSGSFQEMAEQPCPRGLILEKGRAPLGPDGHEIDAAATVVFRWTAKRLLKERHGDKANTQGMMQKESWAKAQALQRYKARAGLKPSLYKEGIAGPAGGRRWKMSPSI
jgi:hypothetical protein